MSRKQELDVIRSGVIQYNNAETQEVSVRFIGTTAMLLNRIRLVAIVGGNEAVNLFVVTEVYAQYLEIRLAVVHQIAWPVAVSLRRNFYDQAESKW